MKREGGTLGTREVMKRCNKGIWSSEEENTGRSSPDKNNDNRLFEESWEPSKKRIKFLSNETLLKNVLLDHLPNVMIFIDGRQAARWKWTFVNKHFRQCLFAFAHFELKDAQLIWNHASKNHFYDMIGTLKRNVTIAQVAVMLEPAESTERMQMIDLKEWNETDDVTHEMDDAHAARISLLRFHMLLPSSSSSYSNIQEEVSSSSPVRDKCLKPSLWSSRQQQQQQQHHSKRCTFPAQNVNHEHAIGTSTIKHWRSDNDSSPYPMDDSNGNNNAIIDNEQAATVIGSVLKREPIKTNISVLDQLSTEHSPIGAHYQRQYPRFKKPLSQAPLPSSSISFPPLSSQPGHYYSIDPFLYLRYPAATPTPTPSYWIPWQHNDNNYYMPYPIPSNAAHYYSPPYPMQYVHRYPNDDAPLYKIPFPHPSTATTAVAANSVAEPSAHELSYYYYYYYYSPGSSSTPTTHRIPMPTHHGNYRYVVAPRVNPHGYLNVADPALSPNRNHPVESYTDSGGGATGDKTASKEKISITKVQKPCLPFSTAVQNSKEKNNLNPVSSSLAISSSSCTMSTLPSCSSSSSSSSLSSTPFSIPNSQTSSHLQSRALDSAIPSPSLSGSAEKIVSNLVFKSKYKTKVVRIPCNKNPLDILNHMIEKKMLMAMTLTKLKPNHKSMKSPSGKYWEVANMRHITEPEKYLVVRSGNRGVNENGNHNRIKYALFAMIPPIDKDIEFMTSGQYHKIDTSPLKISDISVTIRRVESNTLEPESKVIIDNISLFKCNAAVLINNNHNNNNDNDMDCSPESLSGTDLLIRAAEKQLKKEQEKEHKELEGNNHPMEIEVLSNGEKITKYSLPVYFVSIVLRFDISQDTTKSLTHVIEVRKKNRVAVESAVLKFVSGRQNPNCILSKKPHSWKQEMNCYDIQMIENYGI
jgi:hypothetical protein